MIWHLWWCRPGSSLWHHRECRSLAEANDRAVVHRWFGHHIQIREGSL